MNDDTLRGRLRPAPGPFTSDEVHRVQVDLGGHRITLRAVTVAELAEARAEADAYLEAHGLTAQSAPDLWWRACERAVVVRVACDDEGARFFESTNQLMQLDAPAVSMLADAAAEALALAMTGDACKH